MRSKLTAALVAALVLLAGCAGAGGPATAPADTNGSGAPSAGGGSSGGDATVDFYVSDERNDIDDFEHLNVTITRVGFQGADGNWTERAVDNRTVDLTRLQGANATLVESFDVPNGTYTKVFVYVNEVNGTLDDGSSGRVKLPSGKIQLNEEFTVGSGEEVDFVFDITVVKAGNSGKYVLKPVASESGTDVPIEERGPNGEGADDGASNGLAARLSGNVTPNGTATVTVTRNGAAVGNATVLVNGERVGATDANGTLSFAVPDDEELTVRVVAGEEDVEIERPLTTGDGESASNEGRDDNANARGSGTA